MYFFNYPNSFPSSLLLQLEVIKNWSSFRRYSNQLLLPVRDLWSRIRGICFSTQINKKTGGDIIHMFQKDPNGYHEKQDAGQLWLKTKAVVPLIPYYGIHPTNQTASGIKSLDSVPGSAETPRFLQLYEYPTELAIRTGKSTLPPDRHNGTEGRLHRLHNDSALQLGPKVCQPLQILLNGQEKSSLIDKMLA